MNPKTKLVVPYILDRMDCHTLQGIFSETMRSQHDFLARFFLEDLEENDISFIRDLNMQTRILESVELRDFINATFWGSIPQNQDCVRGVQNVFDYDGPFRAHFLVIYPNASLGQLKKILDDSSLTEEELSREISFNLTEAFLEAFLEKRAQQMVLFESDQENWDAEIQMPTTYCFDLERPGQHEVGMSPVRLFMRNRAKLINLSEKNAKPNHQWMRWFEESQHTHRRTFGRSEHYLVYKACLKLVDAEQQALFLMFIPDTEFEWLQKCLRRYIECLS